MYEFSRFAHGDVRFGIRQFQHAFSTGELSGSAYRWLSFGNGLFSDAGLRKARCWYTAARLVQHRFHLDARANDHWRSYSLGLIWRPRDFAIRAVQAAE